MKVLVVDDDAALRTLLTFWLKADGYYVVTAGDAYGAVQAARTERPDVILLDITMPAGHGFSAHERLQKMSTTAGVPVIFMSADVKAGPRALAAGAVGFLPKPLTKDAVIDALKAARP
jgi:CheY-like chemotaxis protein